MRKAKAFISFLMALVITISIISIGTIFASSAVVLYYGDADNNGIINSADARIILRISVKLETYDAKNMYRYDVNKDSKIDSGDARTALRMAVNLDKKIVFSITASPDTPDKPVTQPSAGTHTAEEIALVDKISTQIDYLADGTFYLDASPAQDDGTFGEAMIIACTENTMYFSSDFGDFTLGVLTLKKGNNSNIYMISDEKKVYVQLTDALLAIMGLDKDSISFEVEFDSIDIDNQEYTVVAGSDNYTVSFIQNNGVSSNIVTDKNGNIKRLTTYEANGQKSSDMMINEILDNPPADKTKIPSSYRNTYSATLFFTQVMA